jgi:selenide,water dikinase
LKWIKCVLEPAPELAKQGIVPGGARRNARYLEDKVVWQGRVAAEERDILYDPQTSGGLLMAVPQAALPGLLADMRTAQVPAAVIGRVSDAFPGRIVVRGR